MKELTNGRREHESLRASYTTDKRIITFRNMFLEAFRFVSRCLSPIVVPLPYALLYMIHSEEYFFSTEFVQHYKKIDFTDGSSIWKLIWNPKSAEIKDIMCIIFERNVKVLNS
jgi:hypothetical protein